MAETALPPLPGPEAAQRRAGSDALMANVNLDRIFDNEPGPTVYGYVRHDQADEILIAFQEQQIRGFCRGRGVQLQEIFVDRNVESGDIERTSFTRLVDALSISTSSGVVILDLDHLSPNETVRLHLLDRIESAKAEVFLVPDDSTFKVDGA